MDRSVCSRNPAVLVARHEIDFRERDRQSQHLRGMISHGGFSKMIVYESQGHASGLTYDFSRILRQPLFHITDDEQRKLRKLISRDMAAERHRKRDEARLRAAGAVDRATYEANSASHQKLWEALGMSRRS